MLSGYLRRLFSSLLSLSLSKLHSQLSILRSPRFSFLSSRCWSLGFIAAIAAVRVSTAFRSAFRLCSTAFPLQDTAFRLCFHCLSSPRHGLSLVFHCLSSPRHCLSRVCSLPVALIRWRMQVIEHLTVSPNGIGADWSHASKFVVLLEGECVQLLSSPPTSLCILFAVSIASARSNRVPTDTTLAA